jgi:mannitol/fructose-specific phosphotransferase system IIA component (Ntr-type)
MNLSHIISGDAIVAELSAVDRDSAIGELLSALEESGCINAEHREAAWLSLLKREAVASTALGHGIAIPHAKVGFVENFCGALGVSRGGIDFGAPDGKLVSVVFLFLSPEKAISGHLDLMAHIAAIARNHDFTRKLRRARTREEVAHVLENAERELFEGSGESEF